ncbi:hypothetical protein JCM8097_001729 [Rhodosporidiobolus ruineniae]
MTARALLSLALLLARACPGAVALSAHSPRDLEAHPAFQVVLSDQHLLNDTLADVLAQPLDAPPHSSPPKRHLLRSPGGQAFLCTVPAVTDEAKKRQDEQADKDAVIQAAERERGVQHGLALLEPMRQGCLYQKQNWFTYSFCYGNEIRQFHEIRVPGSVGPSEDPHHDAYTLGVAPEPSPPTGNSPSSRQELQIPSRLGGGDGIGWDEGGKYLTQTWEGGTICDRTGLPRTVEVQYHCNTQTLDRIALIRETSICRYVMLIHTPRLCGEPLFLEGHLKHQEPPATIECQPVVRKLRAQLTEGAATTSGTTAGSGAEGSEDTPKPVFIPAPVTPPDAPSTDYDSPPPPADGPDHDSVFAGVPGGAPKDPILGGEGENDDILVELVYDPETLEIESIVMDAGEDLYVESELRRQLRGERERGAGEAGAGEQEEQREEVTVESLEEFARLLHDTVADALRGVDRRRDGEDGAAPPAAAPPPPAGQQANPVDALIRALNAAKSPRTAGTDAAAAVAGVGGRKMQPGLHKYLQSFAKEKRAVQVPRAAVSEAHEKLRRGFERRWDEGEGEDGAAEKVAGAEDSTGRGEVAEAPMHVEL